MLISLDLIFIQAYNSSNSKRHKCNTKNFNLAQNFAGVFFVMFSVRIDTAGDEHGCSSNLKVKVII